MAAVQSSSGNFSVSIMCK